MSRGNRYRNYTSEGKINPVVTEDINDIEEKLEEALYYKTEEPEIIEEPVNKTKIKVEVNKLNIRKGPGFNYDKTGRYVSTGTHILSEINNNWGKLENDGWVCLDYVTKL